MPLLALCLQLGRVRRRTGTDDGSFSRSASSKLFSLFSVLSPLLSSPLLCSPLASLSLSLSLSVSGVRAVFAVTDGGEQNVVLR